MAEVGDIEEKGGVRTHGSRVLFMDNKNVEQYKESSQLSFYEQKLYLEAKAEENDVSLLHKFTLILTGAFWLLFSITFVWLHQKLFSSIGTDSYENAMGWAAARDIGIGCVVYVLIIGGLRLFCRRMRFR
ncbi:hypothetical protein ECANGB1_1337 [Enterospora canceri]|uniref:Uncharacterized protein n=1 Tax=Enterospora canceri TaxID=1081671 RepID=A0A1Y1S679_9MICR|nr:hypothetical protein ECANGB1_1337 [Enterospora canceri]